LVNLYYKQGFAIGNGLTNPEIQYKAYTDFALDNGLINKEEHDNITELFPQCQKGIEDCGMNMTISTSFVLPICYASYFSSLTLVIFIC
jgi:serine carboxypeptidase-like clade 4